MHTATDAPSPPTRRRVTVSRADRQLEAVTSTTTGSFHNGAPKDTSVALRREGPRTVIWDDTHMTLLLDR